MKSKGTKITVHTYKGGYKHFEIQRKLHNVELVNPEAIKNNVSHSHIADVTYNGTVYQAYLQRHQDGTAKWNIATD